MEFNHINGRASGPLKNKSFTRPTSSSKRSSLLQPSPNFSDRISLGETCEPTVPSFIFSPSPNPPFSTGFRVWKPFPPPALSLSPTIYTGQFLFCLDSRVEEISNWKRSESLERIESRCCKFLFLFLFFFNTLVGF